MVAHSGLITVMQRAARKEGPFKGIAEYVFKR